MDRWMDAWQTAKWPHGRREDGCYVMSITTFYGIFSMLYITCLEIGGLTWGGWLAMAVQLWFECLIPLLLLVRQIVDS